LEFFSTILPKNLSTLARTLFTAPKKNGDVGNSRQNFERLVTLSPR
jgi:hypothetical protein